MIIQLRSIGRAQPDDLAAILPTLSEAAAAVDLDHSRLAVMLDWVQYRKNFRAPVMVRPFLGRDGAPRGDAPLAEIAIDVPAGGSDRPADCCRRRSSSASPRRWGSCPTSTSAPTSRTGCARARA